LELLTALSVDAANRTSYTLARKQMPKSRQIAVQLVKNSKRGSKPKRGFDIEKARRDIKQWKEMKHGRKGNVEGQEPHA
jgi:hypothetical protein